MIINNPQTSKLHKNYNKRFQRWDSGRIKWISDNDKNILEKGIIGSETYDNPKYLFIRKMNVTAFEGIIIF